MPDLVKLRWTPTITEGLPRADREGCAYEAYVPDPLLGRAINLHGASAADAADAEHAIHRLQASAHTLADSEAIARLLLRAEAVASSKIEGLQIGARRLLKAQLAQSQGHAPGDVSAQEIVNNIEAMAQALAEQQPGAPIMLKRLLDTHTRLLTATSLEDQAGRLREVQNWIGGSSYNPCSAEFIPPPPSHVPDLMGDLCDFASQDGLPALVQAACAHAQFETIHPFIDGNGRVGRALIQLILRRRGLTIDITPPISLVLATRSRDYIKGLTATRHTQPAESPTAKAGIDEWVATFAAATSRAVTDAETYEQTVTEITTRWRDRLGQPRRHSAAELLIDKLPGAPIITVKSAATLTGRSEQAINNAVPRLLDAKILTQTTVGRRNRAFEAPEMIDAFTALELQLASPTGNTRHTPPVRAVPEPRRRQGEQPGLPARPGTSRLHHSRPTDQSP